MSNDSYIGTTKGQCTSFVGPDAVNYVRAQVLASSLRLYSKTKILPTRGVTISKLLKMAEGYTGKRYKRGAYIQAAEDVRRWANEMKAALPTQGD